MAPRLSIETQRAIASDYADGVKVIAIAAQYGIEQGTPAKVAKRLGVPARKLPTAPEAEAIREHMARGLDTLDIARAFNVSEAQIWNRLARA